MKYKAILITLAVLPALSCATIPEDIDDTQDATATIKPKVKPELDYSSETPDCVTAGERLAENVQVGMALDEVIRLVGRPNVRLPGSWWWSTTFSDKGLPRVKFQYGVDVSGKPVTGFTSDTEGCPG